MKFTDVQRMPGWRFKLEDGTVVDLSQLEHNMRVIRLAGEALEAQVSALAGSGYPGWSPSSQFVESHAMVPGPAGRDGQAGRDGLPGRDGEDGAPLWPPFAPVQSDLVLLHRQTASASATIDFVLAGPKYAAYLVTLAHVAPATDAVEFWLRTSTDGGSTYDAGAGNYRYANFISNDAAATSATGSTGATNIRLVGAALGNASNELSSGWVKVFNPSAAQYGSVSAHIQYTDSAGNMGINVASGQRLSAGDVDAIRFMMSSGNIASGVFTLYGLVA